MIGAQIVLAARVVVGLVFAVAALGKLGSRQRILETSAALAGLGRPPVLNWPALAVALAGMEAATAILVALPATQRLGLLLGAALLVVFCSAIAVSLRRRQTVTCRCFGGAGGVLGLRHLVRNATLACFAGGALAVDQTSPIEFRGGLGAAAVGVVVATVVIYWDDLATALS
jgi:uncharacterized membrane protein YphA (DoxX/SURF4 family)